MKKPYYVLTFYSDDFIYGVCERVFKKKSYAIEDLKNCKKMYDVRMATIKRYSDVLIYKKKEKK